MEVVEQPSEQLTILILTRNRTEALRRCITSAVATAGCPVRILVGFDEDYAGYTNLQPYPYVSKTLLWPRHYYVRGFNRVYSMAKKSFPDLDYIVVTNDDVEWFRPGWGARVQQHLRNTFPDGHGIAEFIGPDQCAHYMTRAAFIDEHFGGQLGNPIYTMYCSDTEMLQRAKELDRHCFVVDKDTGKALARHLETGDSLRQELTVWMKDDVLEYNKRAQQYGWNVVKYD